MKKMAETIILASVSKTSLKELSIIKSSQPRSYTASMIASLNISTDTTESIAAIKADASTIPSLTEVLNQPSLYPDLVFIRIRIAVMINMIGVNNVTVITVSLYRIRDACLRARSNKKYMNKLYSYGILKSSNIAMLYIYGGFVNYFCAKDTSENLI